MKKNQIKIVIALLLGISSLGYINSQTANSSSNISPPGNLLSTPADMPAASQNNITSPTQNNTSTEYIQENYDLRRFLEEAPPLRKVVYGIDATTYYSNTDTRKTRKAKKGKQVFYEGSLQENTFYNKLRDDLPGSEFDPSSEGNTVGCNANGVYWDIHYYWPQGIISTAEKNQPTEESSYAESRAKMGKGKLDRARNLWINCLIPGTLKWIDDNHFQAQADPAIAGASDEERILTGTVTKRDEQGRPTKIEYQWPAILDKGEIWNEYIYSEPVGKTKLPNIMVQGIKYNLLPFFSKTVYTTNILAYVEIGTANNSSLGYTPSMFFKKNPDIVTPPYIQHQSNDVTYEVINGVMELKPNRKFVNGTEVMP